MNQLKMPSTPLALARFASLPTRVAWRLGALRMEANFRNEGW